MSKFEIGDTVEETGTGDIGVITEAYNSSIATDKSWYIKWTTGDMVGQTLWLSEDKIVHVEYKNEEHAAIALLKKLGYVIYKQV